MQIVSKNPRISRSTKNGFVGCECLGWPRQAFSEATKLACCQALVKAIFFRGTSAASTIAIEPKIGVFQHNLQIAVVHRQCSKWLKRPKLPFEQSLRLYSVSFLFSCSRKMATLNGHRAIRIRQKGHDGRNPETCSDPGCRRRRFQPAHRREGGSHSCPPRKMQILVRATALAAVTIALSDVSSAAACRHFSIWHFPWPQPCPGKQIGQFIHEASPPTPSPPASPPAPIQDGESQRQQAIEKLKEQLNSQKQQ